MHRNPAEKNLPQGLQGANFKSDNRSEDPGESTHRLGRAFAVFEKSNGSAARRQVEPPGNRDEIQGEANVDKGALRGGQAGAEQLTDDSLPSYSDSIPEPSNNRDARKNLRLQPESVYENLDGKLKLPQHGPSLEPAILGGRDFPTVYPRVLTSSETKALQNNARRRVCDKIFVYGYTDVCTPLFESESRTNYK